MGNGQIGQRQQIRIAPRLLDIVKNAEKASNVWEKPKNWRGIAPSLALVGLYLSSITHMIYHKSSLLTHRPPIYFYIQTQLLMSTRKSTKFKDIAQHSKHNISSEFVCDFFNIMIQGVSKTVSILFC